MDLDEVRLKLTAQHDVLRKQLAAAQRLARKVAKGEAKPKELRTLLGKLEAAVTAHCLEEDQMLRPLLATIDAWGPARVDFMEQEHLAAHAALVQAVEKASATRKTAELVVATNTMAKELLAHMEEEEEHLLSPNVLTLEIIRPDQCTG
jgi:iron-sulfur cluster repair protein YtfE (RIC family)